MHLLESLRSRRNLATAAVAGIGGLFLGVCSNALYGFVTKPEWANFVIAIVCLLVAIVLFGLLIPMLRRTLTPYPGSKAATFTENVPRRPALISLVSLHRDDVSNVAETAILHHLDPRSVGGQPLRHCWLLYTDESAGEVERLTQQHPTLTFHNVRLDTRAIYDPKFTRAAVRHAYDEALALDFQPDRVIADATGGNKTMTIGMDLACRELNLSMEYIASEYRNNKPVPGTERFIAIDTVGTSGLVESPEMSAVATPAAADGMIPS